MSKFAAALLGLALATFAALPAAAQETRDDNACTRAWETRDTDAVKGVMPTVSVRRSASLRFDCNVISVYFRYGAWDKDAASQPRVYHFVRLTSVKNGQASEQWADSRKCPAVGEALKSLVVIAPPPVGIPGYDLPRTGPIVIQADGDWFTLSNRLGPEFRGDESSPLGQWTYTSMKTLASCWSSQLPTFTPKNP